MHSATSGSATFTPPDGTTEQLGGFARVALLFGDPKLYSFHIGADVEALFEAPYDFANGSRSLAISDRPEVRIDPTEIVGAANIQNGSSSSIANVSHAQVYSVEAAGNWGPVYFQGEYFWFNVDRRPFAQPGTTFTGPTLHFNGGYAEASWVVTGETRSYDPGAGAYSGVVPDNPFSWANGGWGAWEIAGRYSVIDLNDRLGFVDGVAGGKQTIYTAGLNWYVNRNIRFMLDYLHGIIDKRNGPTGPFIDQGTRFDAVAMRTQIAF
jgi:phosphate-selective porin OprO/OprP